MPGLHGRGEFSLQQGRSLVSFRHRQFSGKAGAVGLVSPHSIRAYYYGFAGEGHIGKLNVKHAFYQVLGTDNFNEIAGRIGRHQCANGRAGIVAR